MTERLTRRERRMARAERLREWAEKREAKAKAADEENRKLSEVMAGSPILVGHHSEGRHRRDLDRMNKRGFRAMEDAAKARDFRSRADNIEAAAERSVYDDDPDAIERLRERLAENEARRAQMKAANAAFRKENRERLKELSSFQREQAMPHPAYELSNIGARINRDRKRLVSLGAAA